MKSKQVSTKTRVTPAPKKPGAYTVSPEDLRNLAGFFDVLVRIDLATREKQKVENIIKE